MGVDLLHACMELDLLGRCRLAWLLSACGGLEGWRVLWWHDALYDSMHREQWTGCTLKGSEDARSLVWKMCQNSCCTLQVMA